MSSQEVVRVTSVSKPKNRSIKPGVEFGRLISGIYDTTGDLIRPEEDSSTELDPREITITIQGDALHPDGESIKKMMEELSRYVEDYEMKIIRVEKG